MGPVWSTNSSTAQTTGHRVENAPPSSLRSVRDWGMGERPPPVGGVWSQFIERPEALLGDLDP